MQFKGHLAGAIAAGTLSAALAALAGTPEDGTVGGLGLESWPGAGLLPPEIMIPGLCFALAGAMALFPDLDIGSIPQRWYLRAMFVALVSAWWVDSPQVFTWLAFAALLPMLHRHRGWTHWPPTPWLIAAAMIWMLESPSPPLWASRHFSGAEIPWRLWEYRALIFACVAGHYTHLLLDAGGLRFFPISARKMKKR